RFEKPSEYRREIQTQALSFALTVLAAWALSFLAAVDSSPVFLWSITQTLSSLIIILVFKKTMTPSEVTVEAFIMTYWASASIIWGPTIVAYLFSFGPILTSVATV